MKGKKMSSLTVRDLCKTYIINKRQNHVLKNISFEMQEGEMVAVMGPSGSGKSTLLYTVSGMDSLTAGQIDFFGKDLSTLSPTQISEVRLEEMGFIFQQMYMLKNLSIYDNIILPAYQSKKNKGKRQQVDDHAKKLMQKMGISEIAENGVNEVSGGQLQRACICRSMMNQPRLLFADEPTGALNRTSSNQVMDELVKLNQEGTTIVMVTHDAKVAARCSRILYIVDGNIKGEYTHPEHLTAEKERERGLNNWLMDLGW